MTDSFAWGLAAGVWLSVVICAATFAIVWFGTKR